MWVSAERQLLSGLLCHRCDGGSLFSGPYAQNGKSPWHSVQPRAQHPFGEAPVPDGSLGRRAYTR
jgi:hypothetical protein